MGPRLVDPEVEKDFRERSKGEREVPSATLSRMVRVLLRGNAQCIEAGEIHGRLKGQCKGTEWSVWSRTMLRSARGSWPLRTPAAENAA